MIPSEKSASVPPLKPKEIASAMRDSFSETGICSFSDVLDSACEKLMESQIKYSIRRIHEMEERLCGLEKELDDFLLQKNRKLK